VLFKNQPSVQYSIPSPRSHSIRLSSNNSQRLDSRDGRNQSVLESCLSISVSMMSTCLADWDANKSVRFIVPVRATSAKGCKRRKWKWSFYFRPLLLLLFHPSVCSSHAFHFCALSISVVIFLFFLSAVFSLSSNGSQGTRHCIAPPLFPGV
jgi:hypothetical protein